MVVGYVEDGSAKLEIDASGCIVAPGQIDMSGLPASVLLRHSSLGDQLALRGITTVHSAPLLAQVEELNRLGWSRFGDYRQTLDLKPLPINLALPWAAEMFATAERSGPGKADQDLRQQVEAVILSGATGIDLSLPAKHLQKEEITEVAAAIAKFGGRLYIWLPPDADQLRSAVDELLELEAATNCPIHVHPVSEELSDENLLASVARVLADAIEAGQAITFDLRPDSHVSDQLRSALPPQALSIGCGLREANLLRRPRRSTLPAFDPTTITTASSSLLPNRGTIAPGQAADLVICSQATNSIRDVLVNGELVVQQGKLTRVKPGKVLRGTAAGAPAHAIQAGDVVTTYASIDETVCKLLELHRVPGAAVAVSRHGQLIYARGFGYADTGQGKSVEPESLFRIASISKPLTAVAVLKLAEEGRLSLDDRLFEKLDLDQEHPADGTITDARLEAITIRQVLQHRAGWDRSASFDPMFQAVRFAREGGTAPPADPAAIIRCMKRRPLDFDPGTHYAYSNFGYCLLGRLIESVSNTSYEAYVRQEILKPIGIQRMAVGATRREGRRDQEVRYYDPWIERSVFAADLGAPVASPYGAWSLESMDAHGGWIGSAVDVVRFADSLRSGAEKQILADRSLELMRQSPEGVSGASYYALGWQVDNDRNGNWQRLSHAGSLPGSSTQLVLRADGTTICILLNARATRCSSDVSWEFLHPIEQQFTQIVAESADSTTKQD